MILLLQLQYDLSASFLSNPVSVHRQFFFGKVRRNLKKTDHEEQNQHAITSNILASSLSSMLLSFTLLSVLAPQAATAAGDSPYTEGSSVVTQSDLGQSVRRSIVSGAKLADNLDLKMERFSDSLRDKNKCDPVSNRRLFDNGFRRDGTRIGNPVLGALCSPDPLRRLDVSEKGPANMILVLAEEAAADTLDVDRTVLQKQVGQVKALVGPAFARAAAGEQEKQMPTSLSEEERSEKSKQQAYNMDIYTRIRAYGEVLNQKKSSGDSKTALREATRNFEKSWGGKIMASLAPNSDRKDFTSVYPAPDPRIKQSYDEGSLLDALGALSATLNKMQEGGVIGHWEISIPEDDYGEVVTIAVDDDISIGAQILSQEQKQPIGGSAVVALVRHAMDERAKISYNLDTFFIDPSTTKQELYNPTQLLVSLSDIGVK
jgi:hypothetical protein